ncbi:hypothetical protein [Streptosporangium roseum]|uniref:hypothetical protein n=1 Tax=Streptosporangium roseum TaxID=2001 RepID=UPI00331EDD5A
MAHVMIRMRLAVLRHSMRGDRATTLVSGVLAGLLLAVGTIVVAVLWPALLPPALAGWLIGWLFGPVLIGGGDESLRPEYFAMIPATPRRRAAALLAGAFAGPAPAVTFVALLSLPVYGWRFGPLGVLAGLTAAVITLVTLVVVSRVVVALLALFVRSRATAAAAGLAMGSALALCGNGWAPVVAFGAGDNLSWADGLLRVLPSGWGVAAVESSWPVALGILAANGAVVVLLLSVWAALLSRRVVSAARGVPVRRGLPRPFPMVGGARAVVAKELRAWWRDLVRIQLLSIAFSYALVFPLLLVTLDSWIMVPFTGLIAAVMAAGTSANMYGTDGTALWLTLMTPGAERTDVRGRQLAWLLAVGPPAVLLSLAGTAVSGESWAWPWVLGLLPAVLGGAAGLIVLVAVTSLVPGTDPHKRGGNPLSTGADEGAETGLVWLMLVAVPATALPAAAAILLEPWAGVPVGLASGALSVWGLGKLAHRKLESAGPELLNLMKHGPAPTPARGQGKMVTSDLPLKHRIAVTCCYCVAWLPLFPQGLAPMVFKILGVRDPVWFLALHLPEAWQWPTIAFMIALGLLMYGYAIMMPLRLSSQP